MNPETMNISTPLRAYCVLLKSTFLKNMLYNIFLYYLNKMK